VHELLDPARARECLDGLQTEHEQKQRLAEGSPQIA
jgi:hypothetical protein